MAMAFVTLLQTATSFFHRSERCPCYHCGEGMRKEKAIMANFQGNSYPVCCHGCLAVLNVIEENGLAEAYLASRMVVDHPRLQ
jgi:3-methyladenine DNA glycosylase Mpg